VYILGRKIKGGLLRLTIIYLVVSIPALHILWLVREGREGYFLLNKLFSLARFEDNIVW
jgi:hypothetical protein